MTNHIEVLADPAEALYTAFFEGLSCNCHLLKVDPPRFTILASTSGILALSGSHREATTGKGIFEVFPSNIEDPGDTGVRQLRASLEHVVQYKEPHRLPVQRYDVADNEGRFAERYWCIENRPVFSPDREVSYIIHTTEDITQKVKAEAREIQIEGIEKVFGLFMHAPMVVGLANGDNYVLEMANDAAFKLWGKGREMIGKPIRESLPELEGQGILEIFDQVRSSGVPYFAHEVPVHSFANGKEELHYFDLIYQPYYGKDSAQATGVFTISHDVTEQVKGKHRAEESERKFRTMAESTPVLIAVSDETSNASYFNRPWSELTGREMNELIQFGWTDLLHPEDKERYLKLYLDAFADHRPFTAEFRVRNPAGVYHWLLAHCVPHFDTGGIFKGYISACTDITDHKEMQQQLQTALEQVRLSKEAAELGTFDLDLEKDTMHWDDRCRTLFGITHHDPVSYERDFRGGLHPDDRERILEAIEQSLTPSVSNGDYDVAYRTVGAEDGVVRWVKAKGKVYFNSDEKPVRFIGSVLDITDQVTAIQKIENLVSERTKELAQANQRLLQTNKELQRSNQNLEEFAHAASHDLKEPVRKIHFFTNQIRDGFQTQFTDAQTRAFGRIENAIIRMGNLIDDLLLYSHVSQRPHEREWVDLNEKVQNVMEDLELDIAEKGAVVHVEDLPVVKGYRRQIQQLLQNLVSNALKYSKEDVAPQIHISAALVTEEGKEYNVIAIRDNGIGFEQQYADKIFQMFTRLHGKAEYSGTGVGLSIVKKVVENHHGSIKVESTPGEGATFRIYLPVE